MPPSRHSSSSHSSSSSRSSSSRSSSSRSSSGPSRHSSSSHSSSGGYSSSFLRSRPSPYKEPSSHSAGSHSSAPAQKPVRSQEPAWRPRTNQPTGFVAATHQRPTYYYGRQHSYAYYPVAWVDAETGRSYEKGYYDENGTRYEDVSFSKNGSYDKVLCHCPYCGQDSVCKLDALDAVRASLQCPNCGGPLELRSQLDEIVSKPNGNTHVYNSEESLKPFFDKAKKKKRRGVFWLVAVIIFASLLIIGKVAQTIGGTAPSLNLFERHETLYLVKSGEHSYALTDKASAWDKALNWDSDADSYFDPDSGCWLWYNTDVEPALWQYWVEGISSDYGDYGWMEHEDSGWYIEKSQGNWIALPQRYSTDALWYLDGD